MIPLKGPTFTQDEIPALNKHGQLNPAYPSNRQCKAGHIAPEGARFFKVSGSTLPREYWGIYCETCLRIAHKLAARRTTQKSL